MLPLNFYLEPSLAGVKTLMKENPQVDGEGEVNYYDRLLCEALDPRLVKADFIGQFDVLFNHLYGGQGRLA